MQYGAMCNSDLSKKELTVETKAELAACETLADLVQVFKNHHSFGHMDTIIYQLLKGNDESKGAEP